ncbi:glycosyl hydrolase family 28-related protein [Rahnella perminowiae]|uniref:glycosyl hydrolase family 28-related protein n=1 Tax=Rahnella perminowiae TaxID=2816244 RepID=UPI001C26894B|nr:glycosyl hydrolase family 28-related protein [Rahnella perminowiae]MBU9825140.1 hypothetical protein [Rahnella perminowiae]
MKLRLTQQEYCNFSGIITEVNFLNGVSEKDVSLQQVSAVRSITEAILIPKNNDETEMLGYTAKNIDAALTAEINPVEFNLGLDESVLSTLNQSNVGTLSVMAFGAVGDGVTDDSLAFQSALTAAHLMGGGRVFVPTPGVEYRLTYPIFLFSNTELFGTGASCRIIMEDPTLAIKGRGCIVIGSSNEINRDKAITAYNAGTFPFASVTDRSFVNPNLGAFLRDNQQFVQSSKCSVHDLYLVARYTGSNLDGGYGVNMVNSQFCSVYNIWGEGWTQLIGIGSDVTPETPSNYECHAYNLHVITPNQNKTYYSIGFIANSTDCSIKCAKQIQPMAPGSANGSGVATNVVENIEIADIFIPDLGRTMSSEGILLNNAKNCSVKNIHIGNAITAVSTYYTLSEFNDKSKPNFINGIIAVDCDQAISIYSKNTTIDNVMTKNCLYELYFGNLNATENTIKYDINNFRFNTDKPPYFYLQNNTVKGWKYQYKYLRPGDIMFSDKSNANTINLNKTVATKAGTEISFLYNIPDSMKAIADVRCYLTFGANALTGNSAGASRVDLSLRRMVAFDGNSNATPFIEMANSRSATSDALTDTNLVTQATSTAPGFIPGKGSIHGLDNSLDVLIMMTNNVVNNVMKEIRIAYYGD